MKKIKRFLAVIDLINEWVGKITGYLLIPMMVIMTYEVIMRYIFNSPTLWAMETNQYLLAVLVVLGGGYVLLNGRHINVDILYSRFGERTRVIIDLLTSPLFFLFIIVLIWQTADVAIESWHYKERWALINIPLYPVRILLVVGAFLLLIQGFAKFVRDLSKAVMKRSPTKPKAG